MCQAGTAEGGGGGGGDRFPPGYARLLLLVVVLHGDCDESKATWDGRGTRQGNIQYITVYYY